MNYNKVLRGLLKERKELILYMQNNIDMCDDSFIIRLNELNEEIGILNDKLDTDVSI
jgi:hypothetical protein